MRSRLCLAEAATALMVLVLLSKSLIAADDGTPEAVVRAATDAMNQGRTEEFAKAMHPESIKKFRTVMMTVVDAAAKDGKADQILGIFPGVQSIEDLKMLEDVTFFGDYLRGVTKRDPTLKEALAKAKIEVLGHIDEGKDTSHVVYRVNMKIDGEEVAGTILAASLKKDGTRWAMLLTGDIESVTFMLEQRNKAQPALPDIKATKIQVVGNFVDNKDNAHAVYRTITPFVDASLKKINVLSAKKTDPEWKAVSEGDYEAIANLIKKRFGL